MIWFYFYIYPSEWPEHEAGGWELVGNMRPDNWASPNKGNLIVRKRKVEERPINKNIILDVGGGK
jgi:hypothetical protein